MGLERLLVMAGIVLIAIGLVTRVLPLGRLPGDIVYRRGNTTLYFPVVTLLLINVALGLFFWFWSRR